MASNTNDAGGNRLAAERTEQAPSPKASPWNDLVGPFYDTTGLTRWLGISRQAVHEMVAMHALLACPAADGGTVYPTWQFLTNGTTIPALREVLSTLAKGADDAWMLALWMQAPSDLLDGHRPSDWLRKGEDPRRVLAMADAAARSLASSDQGVAKLVVSDDFDDPLPESELAMWENPKVWPPQVDAAPITKAEREQILGYDPETGV